jgi:hypothetical protein
VAARIAALFLVQEADMRIAMSQVQLQAVREQAAQTLRQGMPVTLTTLPTAAQLIADPFKNVQGGIHVLAPMNLSLQTGLSPEAKGAAIMQCLDNPAVWQFAEQMADGARDAAKEAAVHALGSCHPAFATAIRAAFTVLGGIQKVAFMDVDDKTVAALVVDGLRHRYVLHPHLANDTVEVGIHPQKT